MIVRNSGNRIIHITIPNKDGGGSVRFVSSPGSQVEIPDEMWKQWASRAVVAPLLRVNGGPLEELKARIAPAEAPSDEKKGKRGA